MQGNQSKRGDPISRLEIIPPVATLAAELVRKALATPFSYVFWGMSSAVC